MPELALQNDKLFVESDFIDDLVVRLLSTHRLWCNGVASSINLPSSAVAEEVVKSFLKRYARTVGG